MGLFSSRKQNISETFATQIQETGNRIGDIDERIIVYHKPDGVEAREYYNIFATMQSLYPEHTPKVFAITSSVQYEGRAVATLNMAVMIVHKMKEKVLVVDADFYQPTIHHYMGHSLGNGLIDILEGRISIEECIKETPISNLFIVNAGKILGEHHNFYDSLKLDEFIKSLRERFEYVIFCTPPVNESPEAGVLSTKLDGVLFVIRAEHTSREDIEKARIRLSYFDANILGFFLIRVQNHIPEFIHKWFLYREQPLD